MKINIGTLFVDGNEPIFAKDLIKLPPFGMQKNEIKSQTSGKKGL